MISETQPEKLNALSTDDRTFVFKLVETLQGDAQEENEMQQWFQRTRHKMLGRKEFSMEEIDEIIHGYIR